MDTKWKNRKKIISFLIFFLGAGLTLGSAADILRHKPSGTPVWQLDRLLENDYQETWNFRAYIADRLENLLIMATGGSGLWGVWGCDNGTYYGDYYGDYWNDYPSSFFETEPELSYPEEWCEDRELTDFSRDRDDIKPLTEQQRQELAQKYHDAIKGDKNLLYTVLYDGRVLYSNADLLPATAGQAAGSTDTSGDAAAAGSQTDPGGTVPADGSTDPADDTSSAHGGAVPTGSGALSTAYGDIRLPEGYNFLLWFDGEKVRILKNGREIDVYGDGWYREENDWYLPGYANFQTDGTVKKAAVCIAVAREPVIYTEGSYEKGKTKQHDNSLYWINANLRSRRDALLRGFIGAGIGLSLLLASFLLRRSRREAAEGIARIQAKIWLECKLVMLSALFCGMYMIFTTFINGYGASLWEEFAYAYEYNYDFSSLSWFFREMAYSVPPLFWIVLFWGLWLVWNDIRHNKKIWRQSLTAKICAGFSAKNLHQPLSRKMSRRNRFVFLAGLAYAVLMVEEILLMNTVWHGAAVLAVVRLLAVLETVLFLVLLYLAGKKNMADARDMEALSRRIDQIRNGDYKDSSDAADCRACSDLEPVMAQLEDIRHGMARAVDEQMKSERMKVELIANVSHDIKTPLTSIISYVEFLKQEEGLPEHVRDYVKILDEKSQRLKNMVTDVFAVSKAASGELPMQMEALDFGKLLRQTLADMEEQIRESPVTFRTELPESPVKIIADGQRLYRVFQNLFQNAIKYSLQGSRVYVSLKADGSLAVASIKNTSRQELDTGKNFAERFTRGDLSRTDGGSGLGLSIAQSFTEACGGTFSWETDADLFVVKVVFQTL